MSPKDVTGIERAGEDPGRVAASRRSRARRQRRRAITATAAVNAARSRKFASGRPSVLGHRTRHVLGSLDLTVWPSALASATSRPYRSTREWICPSSSAHAV